MDIASLGWQAWFTLGVIASIMVALVRDLARPDLILLGGLGLLLLAGIVTPAQGFQGFSNEAVLAVGALFVVAAGVQRTEALRFLDGVIFSRSKNLSSGLLRFMAPTMVLSAFMNNTPLVAMLMPRLQQWGQRQGIPASKLLIPLSYAAVLGGMMTLLGTSTNIIVSGLLRAEGYGGLGMFDLTWVGLPAALLSLLYLAFVGHRLLPSRDGQGQQFEDGLNECLFELKVAPRSTLVGRSVEAAGLRALGDAYLAHIRRNGRLVPTVPGEVLEAEDTLVFVGNAAALDRLLQMPGLARALPLDQREDRTLPLYEAVVADSSALVGKTLRDVAFREQYRGVVLAIQRNDERISGSLGRTPIKAGDLLLVESWNGFDKQWNQNRKEFYLVAPRRAEAKRPLTRKAPLALAILVGMIGAITAGVIPLVVAAFAAALAMIATRCLRGSEARAAVDGSILLAIAATFGIAQAVDGTGLAQFLADGISAVATGSSRLVALFIVYLATWLATEILSNNAAAILMLPVGLATAQNLGLDPEALAVLVAIAASAGFISPIGYQTHLMVMSAGSYRFSDYTKVGLPLSLLVMAVTIVMVYLHWV